MKRKFLLPGEYVATTQPIQVVTVLGSCVSICLSNVATGAAAMNHFIYPSNHDEPVAAGDRGIYGSTANEQIIKSMLALDANPSRLTAQVFGGGSIITTGVNGKNVGTRNIAAADDALASYGIRVIRREVGGNNGMRLTFNSATRTVENERIERSHDREKTPPATVPAAVQPLRVLIVDDSPLVRKVLKSVIDAAPGYEVCGLAGDAFEARDLLVSCRPDVMTLDIIMPNLDGISFLRRVTKHFPTPVVMVSTIAKENSSVARDARDAGAAEIIDKEQLELYKGVDTVRKMLLPKLRAAVIKGPHQPA